MTKLDSGFKAFVKAFVKPFEQANTNTNTNTRFECFTPECQRIVMDSLDIEAGTVVVVGAWEAMRIVEDNNNNKAWVRYDGRTYTHEQFAKTAHDSNEVVRVVHYGII